MLDNNDVRQELFRADVRLKHFHPICILLALLDKQTLLWFTVEYTSCSTYSNHDWIVSWSTVSTVLLISKQRKQLIKYIK